jgi:Mg-chelatase subunit ChlD
MNKTDLTTVIPGSLQAQAEATGASLAETFLSCDLVVIVDTSGSMSEDDAPGGRSRYAAACAELATLQGNHPGKIGVIAFSTTVQFCPGGVPPYFGGGTDLAAALDKARPVNGLCDLVVISDGHPDDESAALAAARRFTESHISTVYVGPEGGAGAHFLRRLAAASGGQHVTAAKTADLARKVEQLLLAAG